MGGELQVTLETRAGVLGTLSLVAVRQEQREVRHLTPLGLAADDELVDHGLRDVGEVAVLRLPQNEGVLGVDRVAVLETHNRDLRERAVMHRERRLRIRQRL